MLELEKREQQRKECEIELVGAEGAKYEAPFPRLASGEHVLSFS